MLITKLVRVKGGQYTADLGTVFLYFISQYFLSLS